MGIGGNKSKSKTNAGYYDPETQQSVDWLKDQFMGQKTQVANPNYSTDNPYQKQIDSISKSGVGANNWKLFDSLSQKSADWNASHGKYIDGARSGGLFDKYYSDLGNNVFTGKGNDYKATKFKGNYTPTDFTSSTYNKSLFTGPTLSETKVDPEMWKTYEDMITGNVSRNASTQIQKMQDEAAYQGRGGGDLADYRAANANREANANAADQIRQLAAQRMQQEFENKADVGKYNAEASKWEQEKNASENQYAAENLFNRQKEGESSKQFGAQNLFDRQQATEASNQFGKNYGLDYLKSKYGELAGNKSALSDLMQLISGNTQAFKKGGSSSSSSKGFSFG